MNRSLQVKQRRISNQIPFAIGLHKLNTKDLRNPRHISGYGWLGKAQTTCRRRPRTQPDQIIQTSERIYGYDHCEPYCSINLALHESTLNYAIFA